MAFVSVEFDDVLEGPPNHYGEILRGLTPSLTALAMARLGNRADADDAVQETLVRVLQNLPTFRSQAPFEHWVFAIAANVVRNVIRREGIRRVPPPPPTEGVDLDPAGALEAREDLSRVLEAMRRLDDEEVAPLLMHYVHGIPQHEVASHLNVSVEHLRVRLYRAIRKVRQALRSEP